MKYHVIGALRETAQDVELLLEAETETDATEMANLMQVLIEKITPVATSIELAKPATPIEYHTLRCDFRDLNVHLNRYGGEGWKLVSAHHDPNDDKMVRCIMERNLHA